MVRHTELIDKFWKWLNSPFPCPMPDDFSLDDLDPNDPRLELSPHEMGLLPDAPLEAIEAYEKYKKEIAEEIELEKETGIYL
jgi:hypothetical protein